MLFGTVTADQTEAAPFDESELQGKKGETLFVYNFICRDN